MTSRIRRSLKQDRGASAVEYGLLIAAISAVIVGVVFGIGGMMQSAFSKTCSTIAEGNQLDGSQCGGSSTPPPATDSPTG